jgi:hypothetical protein
VTPSLRPITSDYEWNRVPSALGPTRRATVQSSAAGAFGVELGLRALGELTCPEGIRVHALEKGVQLDTLSLRQLPLLPHRLLLRADVDAYRNVADV